MKTKVKKIPGMTNGVNDAWPFSAAEKAARKAQAALLTRKLRGVSALRVEACAVLSSLNHPKHTVEVLQRTTPGDFASHTVLGYVSKDWEWFPGTLCIPGMARDIAKRIEKIKESGA